MVATLVEQELINGMIHGLDQRIFKKSYLFTDADPAAGLADEDIDDSVGGFSNMSGALAGVRVAFGNPAPDALAVTVKDRDGVTIASGTLSASGSLDIERPQIFVGGLTVTLSGNAVAGAKATISFYIF